MIYFVRHNLCKYYLKLRIWARYRALEIFKQAWCAEDGEVNSIHTGSSSITASPYSFSNDERSTWAQHDDHLWLGWVRQAAFNILERSRTCTVESCCWELKARTPEFSRSPYSVSDLGCSLRQFLTPHVPSASGTARTVQYSQTVR